MCRGLTILAEVSALIMNTISKNLLCTLDSDWLRKNGVGTCGFILRPKKKKNVSTPIRRHRCPHGDCNLKEPIVLEGIRGATGLFYSTLGNDSHTRKPCSILCLSLKLSALTKPKQVLMRSSLQCQRCLFPWLPSAQPSSQSHITCTHSCLLPLNHKLPEPGLGTLRHFSSQHLAQQTFLWTVAIWQLAVK